jgi:hypothetical protein
MLKIEKCMGLLFGPERFHRLINKSRQMKHSLVAVGSILTGIASTFELVIGRKVI